MSIDGKTFTLIFSLLVACNFWWVVFVFVAHPLTVIPALAGTLSSLCFIIKIIADAWD